MHLDDISLGIITDKALPKLLQAAQAAPSREQRPQGSVPAFAPPTPATAGFPRKPFDRGRRAGRQISVVTSGEAARAAGRKGRTTEPHPNRRPHEAAHPGRTVFPDSTPNPKPTPPTTPPAAPDATAPWLLYCTACAQGRHTTTEPSTCPKIPRLPRRNQLTTPSTTNTPLRHKRSQIFPQHPMRAPIPLRTHRTTPLWREKRD